MAKNNDPELEEQKPKWVNPNKLTDQQRMDKYLESQGLLNYQTKGMSAGQIAGKFAQAGVKVNANWGAQTYGADFRRPQVPVNLPGGGNAGGGVRIMPTGGKADRPKNVVALGDGSMFNLPKSNLTRGDGNVQYATAPNGMVVKVNERAQRIIQAQANNAAERAQRAQDQKFVIGATMDQVLNGEAGWTDMNSFDRKNMLEDPAFYKGGITKFSLPVQQQILNDPNFKWENLPAWQKTFFELSSSPAGMGAAQGALMGVIGGPVGGATGAALGGTLGALAAKSGYDATKEFWEQDGLVAGGFGLMNWLAEQAEKAAGMGFQIANAAVDKKKRVVDVLNKESWQAGANFFEVITPAFIDAMDEGKGEIGWDDLLKAAPPVYVLSRIGDLITNPEKYKGQEYYLGANSPMQLDQSWIERIDQAREEIKKGRPYREVMMDMQAGVVAQLGDMAGQAIADPLNVLPDYTTKIAGKAAELSGNKVAATALNQSTGLMEAGRKYQTLVQTGQALTIDPNFKLDQMGKFSRWVAGINEQGQVKAGSLFGTSKGLLDPIKNKAGWLEDMATQTPHSRAQTGAGMFYENISAMLTMFDDPTQAGKYLKALANNDMATWKELGSRFAESPEFYTVLPALKDFNTSKLDGIIQAWDMTATNRDLMTRIADVMGEQPGTMLEDFVKRGTAEQDFQRVVKKLQESQSPAAKALLAEVEAGTFTADTLKQMVDVFSGEGALPWHPGQWKAGMMDALGDHFDQWVSQRLLLDQSPEAKSAFFRTSALMKQAQSILLLGGSPGYAITNGLSNMVHRAVSGIYGYMTTSQIDTFMERMGVTPARFDEGVGIGGQVEQAAGKARVKTSEIDKAVKGKGALTRAKDALGKLSKGMPFSKASAFFESMEGRQAFSIAMRDAWSQSWRRGVGFREMSPDLANAITQMGQDPRRIYAAIEAGMNISEIEAAVYGRQAEIQARSLIHDAAEKMGMSASEAAQMLERTGVLDTLDNLLKGATTKDQRATAFRRADQAAQDWIDMRTGDDLAAIAESVKQRVGLEGAAAALDVVQRAHGTFFDAWMDHYYRFGEVMNNLQTLDDVAQMDKAIDYAYEMSDREFRRIDARTAANYKGIFQAWGLSGNPNALRVLESVKQAGDAMGGSYRAMRENWRQWRERWANDPTNPARWDELDAIKAQNNAIFRDGFKAKHDAEVQMGKALGDIYESMYGPAAGEAARNWYEDVTAFNDDIVKRERDFRGEMEQARRSGVPKELIDQQKQKYYSETKILLIAEAEKVNADGIARLERVIKGRGTGNEGGVGSPVKPTPGPSNVEGQRLQVEGQEQLPVTSEQAVSEPVSSSPVDEVNALMAAAEQRKATEAREKAERVSAVWDVAEEYWAKGGNYSRSYIGGGGDRYALIGALRKPEYGGIPDLFDLDDPRLTPELTRQILENRKAIKEAAGNEAAEKVMSGQTPKNNRKFDSTKINEDTTILRAIALHGGLNMELRLDITGEKKPKGMPGMFTKKGIGIDEMARMLADDGYPIDVNHPDDKGGVKQAVELINRQMTGNPVYPVGHNYDADIAAAEAAYLREIDGSFPEGSVFDAALWQSEFVDVAARGDLNRLYEMIGEVPEEQLGQWKVDSGQWESDIRASIAEIARMEDARGRLPQEVNVEPTNDGGAVITFPDRGKNVLTPEQVREYGGMDGVLAEVLRTQNEIINSNIGIEVRRIKERGGMIWKDYISRTADEVGARVDNEGRMESVAEAAAQAEMTVADAEYHADAMTWRAQLLEQMTESFKLDEKQARGYGEVNDAVAGWYARMTGESVDDFYNRYFGGVENRYKSFDEAQRDSGQGTVDGGLKQEGGQESDVRVLTFEEFAAQEYGATRLPMAEEFHRQPGATKSSRKRATEEILRRFAENDELRAQAQLEYDRLLSEGKIREPSEIEKLARQAEGHPDNQSVQAARRVLKKRFKNHPELAEKYPDIAAKYSASPATIDKGMVTFDGVKGSIYAFEAADFSTVVHETGHIYRRVLADVAERTQNPYVLRDLQVVEEWAGVKDGVWNREAEEKFARGFEQYTAEGKAPTAALKVAFDNFKKWMLDIYRAITGSQIDVKLTDDVRRVFDRMLGAENLRVDLDNILMQMNYDPKTHFVNPMGYIVERPKFTMDVDAGKVAEDVAAMDIEGMRARVEAMRARMVEGQRSKVEGSRDPGGEGWSEFPNTRYVNDAPVASERVKALKDWTLEKMVEGQKSKVERTDPNILFQEADVPFGEYERASQFHPQSEDIDAGWREKIRPMLAAMEEASNQSTVNRGEGAARDMSPEGQAMLRKYMRQVQNDMATAKLATVRFAEKQRDFALLNYGKRYGADRYADFVMPYQLYTTRSLFTWGARAIDKPALYSNYARLRMQQDRYERDIPERLRGKIKISAPWMPDWMGDAMYIDPLKNLFFPAQIMNHFELRQQEQNYQVIEAERVLQEWQADGQYTDAEIYKAAQERSGKVWERAFEEAQMRREAESSSSVDFFTSFFGPAWYLSTPLNLAGIKVPGISKGDPNKVGTLPLGNTARALETVTKDTWAEPLGQVFGLIGKAEDWGREQFKLPTRGEYAEYYTKRQVANMVAEGLISPEDAQVAMIEKEGTIWEQAKERVDLELAMRVPLAGVTYAALHDGPQAGLQAAVPSLFGSSLLPAGELEYRGLKQEWNEAWKLADAGDTTAITRFFEEYPEYEAYLAKGKDDEELLKSFLVGQIWDSYMALGDTNKKQARAEMGEAFQQSFLDKETRSYETLTVEQLAGWAQSLGGMVPKAKAADGTPLTVDSKALKLYPDDVTGVTDQYFQQRREMFPNYYEEQNGYYALPKSERKTYLLEHPNLKKYWDWKDGWYKAYPEYKPIFNGDAFDRVDTSGWIPGLEDAVREAALTNGKLPSGARAALMNVWLMEGQPMGDFDTWVKSVVMPGMMYGGGESGQ